MTSVYEKLLTRLGEAHPQPRLTAIRRLTQLLGDPQHTAPVVHIAGTNGKTSVSRMIEALLRAHGLRTGMLVSPHLEHFNERISVDGIPVDNETLERAWQDIEPILSFVDDELSGGGELPVTFFEAMTALAFAIFADAPVDVMVVEVGMGGAWDATNVADATVAVFTPIDLDHTRQLGATRAEIAETKAGIIKPGCVAVSAVQSPEVFDALNRAATNAGADLFIAETHFALIESRPAVGGQLVSVRGARGEYPEIPLALHGVHQAQNAVLAIAATEALVAQHTALNPELIGTALSGVSSPGRFERVSTDPLLLVDAAHNPHGAIALASTLAETFPGRECGIMLGVLEDKDAEGLLRALGTCSQTFFVTQPSSERALSSEQLFATAVEVLPDAQIHERSNVVDAIESLRDWVGGGQDRVGVITGSIVLIGEAIMYIREQHWSAH